VDRETQPPEAIRWFNNEHENKDAEWREGEGQMDQEYFVDLNWRN
jgi:hypothetical protein